MATRTGAEPVRVMVTAAASRRRSSSRTSNTPSTQSSNLATHASRVHRGLRRLPAALGRVREASDTQCNELFQMYLQVMQELHKWAQETLATFWVMHND